MKEIILGQKSEEMRQSAESGHIREDYIAINIEE
jgi:hypothetical protein